VRDPRGYPVGGALSIELGNVGRAAVGSDLGTGSKAGAEYEAAKDAGPSRE
jgi:hypothetical protein